LTETLISFVLRRLDQIEIPIFLHRELEGFREDELKALCAKGILRQTSAATEIPRPRHLPPGGHLIVRKTSRGIFGVADEDDYFDPIPLIENDIRQYVVSLPGLVSAIRKENGISGTGFENHDGLIPLGQKTIDELGILNIYLSIPNAEEKDFLSRCQRLMGSPGSQKVVVLTPRGIATSSEGRRTLEAWRVIAVPLEPALGRASLRVDWAGMVGAQEVMFAEKYPKDRRVFQKQGKTWLVIYDGVPKSIDHSVGMAYICRLLQSEGQEIYAAALEGFNDDDHPIKLGSAGKFIDDQARREYKERISEIDKELADAETNHDYERKDALLKDRDDLLSELRRSTGLHGRQREASSDRERRRQAVSKAIHRALKAIKEEHGPLWQHLKKAFKIGEFLSYQPDQPTSWTT
jgi:hypothetical protein